MSKQHTFCDYVNNNHSSSSSSSSSSSPSSLFSIQLEPIQEANEAYTKRRLSDVAWRYTMEVSEEKRSKVKKNEQ